jgi:hypothetical protein
VGARDLGETGAEGLELCERAGHCLKDTERMAPDKAVFQTDANWRATVVIDR